VPRGGFPGPTDLGTETGVLGTPTIDRGSNTAWMVAASTASFKGHRQIVYYLHAIDLRTGHKIKSVRIGGSVTGQNADSQHGRNFFKGVDQLQRPGLLYQNGLVHIGFGSHTDRQPYHGWFFSYNARSLQKTAQINITPHSEGGAIWQAGAGLVGDGGNTVYFATGNGFNSNPTRADEHPESVVKVVAGAQGSSVADWFTPADWRRLEKYDLDLGVARPLLVPGTQQLLQGGKLGLIYNLNRNNLGHIQANDAQATDKVQVSSHELRGGLALWQGPHGTKVFVSPMHDSLQAFAFSGGHLGHGAQYRSTNGAEEGFLTVSSQGAHAGTGIVWSSVQQNGGALLAFDASNLKLLYSSEQNPGRDHSGAFVKFLPPTVAGGRILLGTTANRVDIYGLLPGHG
jgi:hypothetical protein